MQGDTGTISSALLYLREDMGLSSRQQEIVVGVILVGAMVVLAVAFLGGGDSPAQHWAVILGLFAYIPCNGIGMQSVVWLIGPEIVPLAVRGPATGLGTVSVWGFDLLIAASALTTINLVGRSGTFLLYALMNVACVVFVVRKVPETRGRSLEEIEGALRATGPFRKNLHDAA